MALIQCPECGGNVSTAAAVCPHCGFPIAVSNPNENICLIFGEPYDLSDVLTLLKNVQTRGDENWLLADRTLCAKRRQALGVKELSAQDFIDMDRIFDKIEKTGKSLRSILSLIHQDVLPVGQRISGSCRQQHVESLWGCLDWHRRLQGVNSCVIIADISGDV